MELVVIAAFILFLPSLVAISHRNGRAFVIAAALSGLAGFCGLALHGVIGALIWIATLIYVVRDNGRERNERVAERRHRELLDAVRQGGWQPQPTGQTSAPRPQSYVATRILPPSPPPRT